MVSAAEISNYSSSELEERKVPLDIIESIAHQTDYLMGSDGVRASSALDRFSMYFQRDGFTMINHKIEAHKLSPNGLLEGPVIPAVFGMLRFMAKEDRPERGKYRGKLGHQFGRIEEGFPKDWYVNEDGMGENYDARDSNPLALIVMDKLIEFKPDLLRYFIPYVVPMLEWDIKDSERYRGFPAYVGAKFDPKRKFPGLTHHRWTDGEYTIVKEDGTLAKHPITAVEIISLTWAARLKWADRLADIRPDLARTLKTSAVDLEKMFNRHFVFSDSKGAYLADALDGDLNQIRTITVNPAIVLASDYRGRCIVGDEELVYEIIKRMLGFHDSRGGISTVSSESYSHPKNIYHGPNSLWPHMQAYAVEGIELSARRVEGRYPDLASYYRHWGLVLAEDSLRPPAYYGSPIELVMLPKSGGYQLYEGFNDEGEKVEESCKEQAWTGGGMEHSIAHLRSHGKSEVTVFTPRV